ncbi:ribonuclease Oy-like isoform X1 [Scylla paramamosain]|uniref:ribonuclease Oy-like isoform X1 n=2 Tax=Scylla paramamosain TaxID=85552 RepID=UPI0030834B32
MISGVTMRLLLITAVLLVPVINAAEKVTWDVLIFTQQWPITSCISHMEHDPGASCNLFPNMTSWTVHGIWPTTLGTIGPNFCNKSWHFQEKEIIAIEPYLIKYWGNIYAEDSRTSLWKHEWLKHGTCAAQLPQLNTQKKYFEKGLEWVVRYDILAVLTKSNIMPSDLETHSVKNIFQAVKDAFGVDPAIDCIYDKNTRQHILSQIKLCFDPSLKLVDCDGIIGFGTHQLGTCPPKGITYPATVRNGDKTYRYPKKLAVAHTRAWDEANSRCNSWICRALVYVYVLTWMTL